MIFTPTTKTKQLSERNTINIYGLSINKCIFVINIYPNFFILYLKETVLIISLLLLVIVEQGCKNKHPENNKVLSYSDSLMPRLDDNKILDFSKKHNEKGVSAIDLNTFYEHRQYQYIWISSLGVNEHARNFLNLLNQDSLLYTDKTVDLDKLREKVSLFTTETNISSKIEQGVDLELLLTSTYFSYAKRLWGNTSEEMLNKLGWYIKREKINYSQLLDSIINNKYASVIETTLMHPQYHLLRKELKKLYTIEQKGGWDSLSYPGKILEKGDTSIAVVRIKIQLALLGDYTNEDTSEVYTEELEKAVLTYQERNGHPATGKTDKETIQSMNVPINKRIEQILINIERCRWVPSEKKGDYVLVNIPEFKLHVYQNDKHVWSTKIIVGKSNEINNSIIFNDEIEMIVLNPYWNIPDGMLRTEILPKIKNDSRYLSKNNMEVVDQKGNFISSSSIPWNKYKKHFPYIIRQKPGEDNSLGRIKFLFPNPYNIYLHDTPNKELFDKNTRTFSHGCIRVMNPFQLASYLLKNNPEYNQEKIKQLLKKKTETYVKLKEKVPVYIVYFTSWVDENGRLNFRDDVYGHDRKMKQLLFSN